MIFNLDIKSILYKPFPPRHRMGDTFPVRLMTHIQNFNTDNDIDRIWYGAERILGESELGKMGNQFADHCLGLFVTLYL